MRGSTCGLGARTVRHLQIGADVSEVQGLNFMIVKLLVVGSSFITFSDVIRCFHIVSEF